MATTTNYGWTTPNDTDLVKDGAAAIRTLGSSIDTTTKALNPSTTLGDIEYRSSTANTNTRLGIGTNGQYLTVTGGVPAWGGISAGGMTLLSTTTLSGATTTISNIDQGYVNLVVHVFGVTNATADGRFRCLPNNSGSITTSFQNGSATEVTTQRDEFIWLTTTANNATRTNADNFREITISNYASTTARKGLSVNGGYLEGALKIPVFSSGFIATNSAITSLVFSVTDTGGNMSTGTVLVYGVK
jgi:hypothetical protein